MLGNKCDAEINKHALLQVSADVLDFGTSLNVMQSHILFHSFYKHLFFFYKNVRLKMQKT